jgi:alkaline phosphatase
MSKYVDVYLLPIAEANVPAYKKVASKAGEIFMKHGALRYREYVASDLDVADWGILPFPKVVKLKPGETIIYAAVEFKSEAHRNKTMKKIFADPAMDYHGADKLPFDPKRMAYGGFKVLVDL